MFRSIFSSPQRPKYLASFSIYLLFPLWCTGATKSSIWLLLLLILYSLRFFHPCVSWWSLTGAWANIYYSHHIAPCNLSHQLMVFHWSLSDNIYPQVSSTLLRISADFKNAVVFIVSICLAVSNFSNPFTKNLQIVPSTTITIGNDVNFISHSFFNSLSRSNYLALFFFFFF